jgi:hypothetical protein
MNKLIIRGVLLLAVIGLLLIVLFHNRSPFGKDNSTFASEPQKEITKIEFSDGNRKLTLDKEGSEWLINGKTEARKSGILYILRVLQEIKIKSPVSDGLFEGEISSKKIIPVKVRVYEKRKLLNSFLVYKTPSNPYGEIMKRTERAKPFIVYVPGYDGEIGSGFTLNELFWQTYTIFNLLPSEIASVNFENLSDTSSSFSIVNKNRHVILSGPAGTLKGWDTTIVTRYLSYFTFIPFESWAFDISPEQKKMVESEKPAYILTVNTTLGKKIILTLWERMKDEKGGKTKDTDRLFGKTQNSDAFFIIRYFDVDPLLKKRSYFFPK